MKIRLLILTLLFALCNNALSESRNPPPIREHSDVPATLKIDPVQKIRIGNFVAEFEKTTLAEIRNAHDSGSIEHSGDAGGGQYWLCYSKPGQRIWFISPDEMGGPKHSEAHPLNVPIIFGGRHTDNSMPADQKKRNEERGIMNVSDSKGILRLLENCENSGNLQGVTIEYWIGGGLPPPYYRSDQFRLLTVSGRDMLEYSTLKWDKNPERTGLQEKFSLPAQPSDIKSVARLLREKQVFVKKYAEEDQPGIADILSFEIIVSSGVGQEKRTYYRKLPEDLASLRTLLETLIDRAKSKGKKELRRQGNPTE
jgi:hypothetical protein